MSTSGDRVFEDTAESIAFDTDLSERPGAAPPFATVLDQRLSRRHFLAAAATTLSGAALSSVPHDTLAARTVTKQSYTDSLTFTPIMGSTEDAVIVPKNYRYDVLLKWGESLFADHPDLNVAELHNGELLKPGAGQRQAHQFGYNCDAIEFFPLEDPDKALLCVNHEYCIETLMFPGWSTAKDKAAYVRANPETVAVGKASHGVSVVELHRINGRWVAQKSSAYNRRITADTPIMFSGPAAGHPLLKTARDPHGTVVHGTIANCAGGATPWGTYLTTEENMEQYFGNFRRFKDRVTKNADDGDLQHLMRRHNRIFLPRDASLHYWELIDDRFDVDRHPTEAFRFGWVVEIDPTDPQSTPRKRTALGRFKHECATTIPSQDGRCVVYSGDDAGLEYAYKFVTKNKIDPSNRAANMNLLDEGTLYVARFDADGTGKWLAVDYNTSPALQAEFTSQAEVLIDTRRAGDILGATPMDRPEDFEANPVTKKVYLACTNNAGRTANNVNAANPRGPFNRWGHIIEITEEGDDNAALTFTWTIFIMCGDPAAGNGRLLTAQENLRTLPLNPNDSYYAGFADAAALSPIGAPDNLAFDNLGNLWIITDGRQPRGANNGAFVAPTMGPTRGYLRQFLSGPREAEICGGEFTPDNETWFLSIQHPGEAGTVENPTSYWPEGKKDPKQPGSPRKQPRPSVIAVVKDRGDKRIGS